MGEAIRKRRPRLLVKFGFKKRFRGGHAHRRASADSEQLGFIASISCKLTRLRTGGRVPLTGRRRTFVHPLYAPNLRWRALAKTIAAFELARSRPWKNIRAIGRCPYSSAMRTEPLLEIAEGGRSSLG